jgi:signal transduction histidine kinase
VNVSSNLISDLVRKSKVSGVAKAVGLLREHESDLSRFFSTDGRAQQFTTYLAKLSEHLGQEQTTLLNEVALLSDHIEHIKEIVVMQQSYAKSTGMREPLTPRSLLEDALRINSAALARHDVHVSSNIDETPRVMVDRHKVLQILINLISNAKYALDEGHPAVKELRISVRSQGQQVRICVEDNGIGISPENLTRIFQHGFTTRNTGHGFGLHSAALAAKELGGSLRAYSDGPGHGARFVLNLPAEIPAADPLEVSCKN